VFIKIFDKNLVARQIRTSSIYRNLILFVFTQWFLLKAHLHSWSADSAVDCINAEIEIFLYLLGNTTVQCGFCSKRLFSAAEKYKISYLCINSLLRNPQTAAASVNEPLGSINSIYTFSLTVLLQLQNLFRSIPFLWIHLGITFSIKTQDIRSKVVAPIDCMQRVSNAIYYATLQKGDSPFISFFV